MVDFHGCSGIGCISDSDPQPLLVRSPLGIYAISTVGIINNAERLVEKYFSDHGHQFMAMSSGKVNSTELVAALINQCDDLVSGILHAQDEIEGSVYELICTGTVVGSKKTVKSVTNTCLFVCIVFLEFHNHIILSYLQQMYRMRTLPRA